MKTPEEILNKYLKRKNCITEEGTVFHDIIEAMEEYADQFKQPTKVIPSDEEIHDWVCRVQPARGGFKEDYVFAAKAMRDGKIAKTK